MGAAARHRYLERYTGDANYAALMEIYDEVLRDRAIRPGRPPAA
jgi:hypothetical protein